MPMSSDKNGPDKIEAIKNEFHDRNDLEIEPGYRVNDLVTRDECNRAIVKLSAECDTIVRQIEAARLNQAKGIRQLDGAWMIRAQSAIRWKRTVMKAIRAKLDQLPAEKRREGFRKALLEVIEEDIGEEKMSRYAAVTRARHPDVSRQEAEQHVESGEKRG